MIETENQVMVQIEMIEENLHEVNVLLAAAVILYVLQKLAARREQG